jgi:nucleolysin TIA-1/TIAR
MYGMQPNSYGQYGFGGYGGFPNQAAAGAAPGGASTGVAQGAASGAGLGLQAGQPSATDPNAAAAAGQGSQGWAGADPSYYQNTYWGKALR